MIMATPVSVEMLEKDEKGRNVIRAPPGGAKLGKSDVGEFLGEAMVAGKIKVKLPFSGTNIKVSKNQDVLDASGANKIVEKVKEVVEKPAPKKRGRPKKTKVE